MKCLNMEVYNIQTMNTVAKHFGLSVFAALHLLLHILLTFEQPNQYTMYTFTIGSFRFLKEIK